MKTISRQEFLSIGTAIVLVLLTVPLARAAAAGVTPTSQELRAEQLWFKQHLLDCLPKAPQPGQAPIRLLSLLTH